MQIPPIKLLVPEILEIVVKYLYVKSVIENKDVDFFTDLYRRHIYYRTGGVEDAKATVDDYVKSFNILIASMRTAGFDRNYPIPVSTQNGIILDGSHRLACALFFDIHPYVEFIEGRKGNIWDYWWFEQHGFSKRELDLMLRTYIELKPQNVIAIILWGPVKKYWAEIQSYISAFHKIIAARDFLFDRKMLASIVYDIYAFEDGLKVSDAVRRKVALLQNYTPEIRLILAEVEEPECVVNNGRSVCKQALTLKRNVRHQFGSILPSSLHDSYLIIHTSDNSEHLRHITNILLNQNNLIALRGRRHSEYREKFLDWLEEYRRTIVAHGINSDSCCIVGSSPLEVFSIRDSTDIDFILKASLREGRFPDNGAHLSKNVDIVHKGYHRSSNRQKLFSDDQIIHDIDKHFYFRGLKFATLEIVRDTKSYDARPKDVKDVKLIDRFLERIPDGSKGFYSKEGTIKRISFLIVKKVKRWFELRYMLRQALKYIPPSIKANKVSRRLYGAFIHAINFSPKKYLYYRYHSRRIKKFENIHKGQRCFIIGTGPSLNKTNLSLIKEEIIFGVNTLYRGLSKFGITCDYYAITDLDVWQKHFKNILGLDTVLFLSGGAGESYLSKKRFFQKFQKNEPFLVRDLGSMWSSKCFSKDLSMGTYNGDTIIIDICLQAAYYMGFKEVYLLGCDSDYSGLHRFDGLITENLQGGGVTGDWSKVFDSYEICKKIYEEDGREIINATVGGKLEIFKRKKLEEIILSREVKT